MIFNKLFPGDQNKSQFILDYEKLFSKSEKFDMPIFEKSFSVIDVESDGLNPKKDSLLSIGIVKIVHGKIEIEKSLEIYIEQSSAKNDTVHIHGITKNGSRDRIAEKEAIRRTIEFIGNDIFVGHNIIFDIGIINTALKNHFGISLKNISVDTVDLYFRINSRNSFNGGLTLDKLCEEYNVSKSDRHTAAGDAFITAQVFLKLVKRLEKRGIKSIKGLTKKRILHI